MIRNIKNALICLVALAGSIDISRADDRIVDIRQFNGDLANAVNNSHERKIIISTPTTTLRSSLSTPMDVEIEVTKGGLISYGSNTLVINGPFKAGLYSTLSGTASMSFGMNAVKEVYPEWWGAKGDGATDDSSAINSALWSGSGHIKFNEKTYFITNHIYAKSSGLLIEGVKGKSIIKVGAWVDGFRISAGYPVPTEILYDITIRGLTINGNRAGYTNGPNDTYGNGINLLGVDRATVEDCDIFDAAQQSIATTFWPVITERQTSLNILNNTVRNTISGQIAIGAEGHSENVKIIGNSIINGGRISVEDIGESGTTTNGKVTITDNHLNNTTGSTIAAPGIEFTTNMIGGTIGNNTIQGYDIGVRVYYFSTPTTPVKSVTILGNNIFDFVSGGIYVSPIRGNADVQITGNRMNSSVAKIAGIFVSNDCNITGNKININSGATTGVYLYNDNNLVVGNYINANGQYDILLAGNNNTAVGNKIATDINDRGTDNHYFANYGGTTNRGTEFYLQSATFTYGLAAPTTGTWKAGSRVWNIAPAVGQPKSWVCTVAGTPGTWVSEGNL